MQLTNHRNDRPSGINVVLNKLSLFSRQYRMDRMTGQLLSGDGTAGAQVDWRERVTVHYRLVPLERDRSTSLLSECSFAEDTTTLVEGALSPSTDYLCLEKACAEFEVGFFSSSFICWLLSLRVAA